MSFSSSNSNPQIGDNADEAGGNTVLSVVDECLTSPIKVFMFKLSEVIIL